MTTNRDKDKKKKQKNELENMILSIMEKSLKEAINQVLDDLLKDFS